MSAAKASTSRYLLTGLLETPDGVRWSGNGNKSYRTKLPGGGGRWLEAAPVDKAVLEQIGRDAQSPECVSLLHQQALRAAESRQHDSTGPLRRQVAGIDTQISKCMDLALKLDDPAPALKKIDELNAKRATLAAELQRAEREYMQQSSFAGITKEMISGALRRFGECLDACEPEVVKMALQTFVAKVVLDPKGTGCQIHYKIPIGPVAEAGQPDKYRTSVALLPGFEPGFKP